jgi:hypothetical protein
MLIDFERSKILEKPSVLQPSSPNLKRKHWAISDDAYFVENDWHSDALPPNSKAKPLCYAGIS